MLPNNLFRFSGYTAILCAVFAVIAISAIIVGIMNEIVVFACFVAATILFLPVVYTLYVVHRATTPGLAATAAILTAIGTIASLFFDPTVPGNATPAGIVTLIFGVGVLLFGWLAFGNTQMPHGIAIVVWLAGGISLLSGILFLAGSVELGGFINLASVVPFIVWAVWLGTHFLSRKLATA